MSEAWRVASITYFEQVPVGVADALLRVAAISSIDARPDDPRPTLVADDGVTVTRFDALPAPPDEGADLRCGYSVGSDLDLLDTAFSLELEDGNVIALSSPTLTAPIGAPAVLEEALDPADPLPAADPFDAPELPAGDGWAADGEPALGLLLDAAQARAELTAMRELRALQPSGVRRPSRSVADGDAEGRLAELELWSGELERRLADASTELEAAQRDAARDAAELERLRAQLTLARSGEAGDDGFAATSAELSDISAAALAAAGAQARRDLADAGA